MDGARLSAQPVAAQGYENDFSRDVVAISDPAGFAAEAYRTLRTNLFYALVDTPPKVIVVTSTGLGEGKSVTCANLGVVLAQADKRTLIIDCDLRRPSAHKLFGTRNMHGVVNILTGERTVDEVSRDPLKRLTVVTTGPLPPNPAELLSSRRFAKLLEGARQEFDYVLIDAPPVQPVSDPIIISTQGDGVLLVVDSQSTRKAALRQSVRNLEAVGAKVLGTVMNRVKVSARTRYQYRY